MSYAIFELDIRQPPASLHTHAGSWYVLCERCDKRGPLRTMISEALLLHEEHVDVHIDDDEIALREWLSSTRRALVVHSRIHNEWRDFSTTATVEATRRDVA